MITDCVKPVNRVEKERRRLLGNRRTIRKILFELKTAVESRAIDVFWVSRKKNRLRNKPEKVAQGLLAVFGKGTLLNTGLVLRELFSGIGFVDVAVIIARTLHLIEVKIVKGSFAGIEQLGSYMKTEHRKEGWLICFDARPERKQNDIQSQIILPHGVVRTVVVNINPTKPSMKK